METVHVCMSSKPLSVDRAVQAVSDPAHGAVDTFVGTVRNNHAGKDVTGITYDAHKAISEKAMREICAEAQGMWPETKYFIEHFYGDLPVGGISIIIAVSTPHRAESFEACRYVIEEVKKRLPVWKKEHYVDGVSDWLPGHSLVGEVDNDLTCCGTCKVQSI